MTDKPRKLADITTAEAHQMLDEHKQPEGHAACGCDRCIVLRGLVRGRTEAS